MVVQLQDKVSEREAMILHKIQIGNEDILLTIMDKIESNSETCTSTNSVSEMGEALRKELQALLCNHSLRLEKLEERVDMCDNVAQMNQNQRNQTVPIKEISQPLDDVQQLFDNTFTLRAQYDGNNHVSKVTCFSEENTQEMDFSRFLDTGTGEALPNGIKTYSMGKRAVLDFSSVGHEHRTGVYQCEYQSDGRRERISFLIRPDGYLPRPHVASIGDSVELDRWSSPRRAWKWLRNGLIYPSGDGLLALWMGGVRGDEAGVYERYEDRDRRGTQWFWKLVVRGCRANLFGESCDKVCPHCYNGGTCHELLGTCVCPPGFEGINCEVACGENRVGSNCSESCEGGNCLRQLFCRPDPYGCSCASGYHGYYCELKCDKGRFGAACRQTCHCASGPCDPYTGACSGDCSPGWTGPSCQIPA